MGPLRLALAASLALISLCAAQHPIIEFSAGRPLGALQGAAQLAPKPGSSLWIRITMTAARLRVSGRVRSCRGGVVRCLVSSRDAARAQRLLAHPTRSHCQGMRDVCGRRVLALAAPPAAALRGAAAAALPGRGRLARPLHRWPSSPRCGGPWHHGRHGGLLHASVSQRQRHRPHRLQHLRQAGLSRLPPGRPQERLAPSRRSGHCQCWPGPARAHRSRPCPPPVAGPTLRLRGGQTAVITLP